MADLDPARTSTVVQRSGLNLRLVAFTLLVIAAVLVGAAYLVNAALRAAPAGGSSVAPAGLGYDGPMLMFIHAAGDQDFGKLAFVPADDPSATRTTSSMHCERVHYAAGRGLCLVLELGLVSRYRALAFGPDLQTTAAIDLDGLPSRTRISPDGRYGAVTVFVSGHSYASDDFSTRTTIIDLDRGVTIGDLESFTTMRDGTPWRAQDFNFWGITFTHADSNRFYATLRTGEDIYLVEGDVAAQRLDVVGEAIECPAISPDDTRLAFKKRQPDGFTWRLSARPRQRRADSARREAGRRRPARVARRRLGHVRGRGKRLASSRRWHGRTRAGGQVRPVTDADLGCHDQRRSAERAVGSERECGARGAPDVDRLPIRVAG